MNIQFPRLFLFSVVIAVTPPIFAQQKTGDTTSAASEMAKARELFPQFQKAIDSDPEKAKESFDAFLKMPDPVKKRLQTWLDAQWLEKRREYENAVGKGGGGGGLSRKQERKLVANRTLLEEIREMDNETAMKKILKSKGKRALDELLAAMKRMQASKSTLKASPQTIERLLNETLTVGEFRYKIRFNRGQTKMKPREELKMKRADAKSEAAEEAARKAKAIMAENVGMMNQIPEAEYQGIFEANQWRIAAGLQPLIIDPKLCEAGRDHSNDMATLNFFAHDSPVEGKESPSDRAQNFGTTGGGENIAQNSSPAGANLAWFYSPGHHKNLFRAEYTHIGLGITGGHYTQMFR